MTLARTLARRLLESLLPEGQREALLGDLDEEYAAQLPDLGPRRAEWRYCREALLAILHTATNRRRFMTTQRARGLGRDLLHSAIILITFWLLAYAAVRGAYAIRAGWPAVELAQLAAGTLALAVSLRRRARLAALLLAGFTAFSAAELAAHSAFSIRAVQGAPAHLTVMMASVLGVLLGVVGATRMQQRTS
jgi:hypothetical protein